MVAKTRLERLEMQAQRLPRASESPFAFLSDSELIAMLIADLTPDELRAIVAVHEAQIRAIWAERDR